MAKIALKVDIDTLRGTQEGAPNLARTLERFGLKATFLFVHPRNDSCSFSK